MEKLLKHVAWPFSIREREERKRDRLLSTGICGIKAPSVFSQRKKARERERDDKTKRTWSLGWIGIWCRIWSVHQKSSLSGPWLGLFHVLRRESKCSRCPVQPIRRELQPSRTYNKKITALCTTNNNNNKITATVKCPKYIWCRINQSINRQQKKVQSWSQSTQKYFVAKFLLSFLTNSRIASNLIPKKYWNLELKMRKYYTCIFKQWEMSRNLML